MISTLSNWKTVKKNVTARKERPNLHLDPVILYLETAPRQSSTGPWSFISPEARKRTCFKPKKKMVSFKPAEQKFHSKTSKCLRRPRISVRSRLHPTNYWRKLKKSKQEITTCYSTTGKRGSKNSYVSFPPSWWRGWKKKWPQLEVAQTFRRLQWNMNVSKKNLQIKVN